MSVSVASLAEPSAASNRRPASYYSATFVEKKRELAAIFVRYLCSQLASSQSHTAVAMAVEFPPRATAVCVQNVLALCLIRCQGSH